MDIPNYDLQKSTLLRNAKAWLQVRFLDEKSMDEQVICLTLLMALDELEAMQQADRREHGDEERSTNEG